MITETAYTLHGPNQRCYFVINFVILQVGMFEMQVVVENTNLSILLVNCKLFSNYNDVILNHIMY